MAGGKKKSKAVKLPGYFYFATEDGALAVEMDTPCEGATTLTWQPKTFPGKSASVVIPTDIFGEVMKAYVDHKPEPPDDEPPDESTSDDSPTGPSERSET